MYSSVGLRKQERYTTGKINALKNVAKIGMRQHED